MCKKKVFICILTCFMMLTTSIGVYALDSVPGHVNDVTAEEYADIMATDSPEYQNNDIAEESSGSVIVPDGNQESVTDPADSPENGDENLPGEDDNVLNFEDTDFVSNLTANGFISKEDDKAWLELTWEKISEEAIDGYIVRIEGMEDYYVEDSEAVSAKLEDLETTVFYEIQVIPFVWEEQESYQPGADAVKTAREGKSVSVWGIILAAPQVTAKAGDAKVTLTWAAVAGATSYEIVDAVTGEALASDIKTTSYVAENLKNSKTYKYQVRAVAENEEATGVSELSNTASATTKITKIGKIKTLTATRFDKGVTLKWSAVSGATKYYVYKYDSKTKKWTMIKSTTSTQYKDTKLVVGRKYRYVVKPLRVSGGITVQGTNSPYINVTGKAFHTTVQPMMYKIYIYQKGNLYTSYENAKKGKKCGTLKAGKTATLIDRKMGFSKIKYNGKYYWFSNFKFSYSSCVYSSGKDYTTATKEAYVNSKKYSSKTKYLIWVNGYTQRVNIYKGSKGNWKLIKTYKCCTGTAKARTQSGTYKIKYKEKGWFYVSYCCRYVTHFAGRTSFHTRPQKTNGKLVKPTLGKPVSNGCVRMTNEGAKYIYKNIPKGTTVISN